MAKKVSRRSFIKKTIGSVLTMIGTGYGGYFYAHQIEPRLLKVASHSITHTDIPSSFNGFKIVQFSDTHLGFQYNLDQFKKMLNQINQLQPDVIFFTGDLMDAPNQYPYAEEIIPLLKNLQAPFGKYAIYGNHDHGGYGSDIYKNIMDQSEFTLLLNQSEQISMVDKSRIHIIGLDDAMLGKPNFSKAFHQIPSNEYKILLSHAPDLADEAVKYNVQIQLSGHSHGGQIKIPFVGALITPPFAKKYVEGFYEIENLLLYVNRGIGTTRLPFRFLSKPEITMFTLSNTN
ncbi:metallophosphoesterase [Bacillus sp. CGMCC 1.16607]|uniref:metallophosphoesterase n=1 Tax=Bacillus sp. CGMCC 1.16607 TaxID=3351842 RepID=UPI003637B937